MQHTHQPRLLGERESWLVLGPADYNGMDVWDGLTLGADGTPCHLCSCRALGTTLWLYPTLPVVKGNHRCVLATTTIKLATPLHPLPCSMLDYIYVCMYVCMYICVYVCIYVCMYVYVCMCVCVYVCIYVCMYVYVCMCVCMYVYMCVCVYIRIYMCRQYADHSSTMKGNI